MLVQFDADVNKGMVGGETPVWISVKFSVLESLKTLIQAKANVSVSNTQKVTPLHMAVSLPDDAVSGGNVNI